MIFVVSSSEGDLRRIIDSSSIRECGMKVSENKSKVVCLYGEMSNTK